MDPVRSPHGRGTYPKEDGGLALFPGVQAGSVEGKSRRSQNPATLPTLGRLPILATLATRIQSAMMYGSWTWCHLKVTT